MDISSNHSPTIEGTDYIIKIKSHKGRLTSNKRKMANNKEISIEMIAKIAMLAAKTAIDEIPERKQEDIYTRCRGEITGMK